MCVCVLVPDAQECSVRECVVPCIHEEFGTGARVRSGA
jgi:hypothetical protein